MKYYIAENGQPAGPFEIDELLQHGLTVNSLVWNDTLTGWTKACEVAELDHILTGGVAPAPAVGAPVQQESVSPEVEAAYAPQKDYTTGSAYAPQESAAAQSLYAPQNTAPDSTSAQEPVADHSAYAPQQEEPVNVASQQPQETQFAQERQYAQPQYAQQPYGQQQQLPMAPPVTNKTMSIIVTILSFMCCCNIISGILGIIAIVKASNATSAFYRGDRVTASVEAEQARKFSLWALIIMLGFAFIGFLMMLFSPAAADVLTESLSKTM